MDYRVSRVVVVPGGKFTGKWISVVAELQHISFFLISYHWIFPLHQ